MNKTLKPFKTRFVVSYRGKRYIVSANANDDFYPDNITILPAKKEEDLGEGMNQMTSIKSFVSTIQELWGENN